MNPFGQKWKVSDYTITDPLHWKKPRHVRVEDDIDLFHESIPDAWIDKVFAVMALCPQHTFQVLTKRSKRMREYMLEQWQPAPAHDIGSLHIPAETRGETRHTQVGRACEELAEELGLTDPNRDELWTEDGRCKAMQWQWPLKNVWLGVSAEDQARADERIPDLLATPAAVRFVSAEPLLGHIEFLDADDFAFGRRDYGVRTTGIDWVIAGGESGSDARPMHPDWVRSIRDQCQMAGVPFFHKQNGEFLPSVGQSAGFEFTHIDGLQMSRVGKRRAGHLLDGRAWREFPR